MLLLYVSLPLGCLADASGGVGASVTMAPTMQRSPKQYTSQMILGPCETWRVRFEALREEKSMRNRSRSLR